MKMKDNCWYCIVLLQVMMMMMMMVNTIPIAAVAAFEEYNNASDGIGRDENWLLASETVLNPAIVFQPDHQACGGSRGMSYGTCNLPANQLQRGCNTYYHCTSS
ncbi:Rapid ALkalinization Factor protein [Dioscorea alata]|uniref:Rapid ALkalinization Factor protein n=1 Tax=Dioscorea alata TaxID=55571 RepID=A0ACB7VGT6_DIOAL|nr:Rapid ALkalinization Factor protein [Dioscorea alata]